MLREVADRVEYDEAGNEVVLERNPSYWDAAAVKLGQKVEIKVPALGERQFSGKVAQGNKAAASEAYAIVMEQERKAMEAHHV